LQWAKANISAAGKASDDAVKKPAQRRVHINALRQQLRQARKSLRALRHQRRSLEQQFEKD
jgi:hypothetical protein